MVRAELQGAATHNLQPDSCCHTQCRTKAPALAVLILHTIVALTNAATLIPDRPALDAILAGSATTETFERFNLSNQPALFMPNCVDSSTILPAGFMTPEQGPGLVVNGVTFCSSLGGLRIQGPFGGRSQALWLENGTLSVAFFRPVNAFGFNYNPFVTIGTDVTITLFASDGTTRLQSDTTRIYFAGSFIGYLEPAGIGKIEITSEAAPPLDYVHDTMIDDLTFGIAIIDSDGDGVPDNEDLCPDTAPGAIVDAHGCSIDQLVPCTGPAPGHTWKNHGAYVSAIAQVADTFLSQGRLTRQQKDAIVQAAANSSCGRNERH